MERNQIWHLFVEFDNCNCLLPNSFSPSQEMIFHFELSHSYFVTRSDDFKIQTGNIHPQSDLRRTLILGVCSMKRLIVQFTHVQRPINSFTNEIILICHTAVWNWQNGTPSPPNNFVNLGSWKGLIFEASSISQYADEFSDFVTTLHNPIY